MSRRAARLALCIPAVILGACAADPTGPTVQSDRSRNQISARPEASTIVGTSCSHTLPWGCS